MSKNTLCFDRLKGRENFCEWKTGARAYLISKGHWAEMDKELAANASATDKESNLKALAELTLLVDPSLYSYVSEATTAKQAWNSLLSVFESKGAVRKVTLLKKWISLKSSDYGTMQEYVNMSVALRGQIKSAGFDISEEIAGCIMLCGLSSDYNSLVMGLEVKDSLTLDYVKTVLLQNIDFESGEQSAMSAKYGKNKNKNGKKKPIKCYDCGGPHYKNKCPNKAKNSEKSECVLYSALAARKVNDHEWYADSGATRHMTHENLDMDNKRSPIVPEVRVANDEKLKIVHVGDVKCNLSDSEITLKDVQYVPDLCVNLLSVSQMVKKGHTVVFDINGCKIYNKEKQVIAVGVLKNDMFQLNIKMNESVFAANTNKANSDYALWHRRLAHVNFNSLKSTLKISVPNGLKCKVCAKGKHARAPFNETGTRATKPLEIIHSDVCGKFPVRSLGGANYFVTFIDDFTRKIFIYPIASKDMVFSCFVEFKNRVENEMEKKIKIFRSDNGTEYDNKKFKKFFAEHGIKFETSTIDTPQQNGVAERNNRTILEKARCMLLDSSLSKQFWAEAVCAAVDIINVLPNAPNGVAPNELWNGKKCDLDKFKVFGCRAMVWLPNRKRSKLDAKSVECIFLRNASNSKAYRLYNEKTKKIVVSRDVIFMENDEMVIDSNNNINKNSYIYIEDDTDDEDNVSQGVNQSNDVPENIARREIDEADQLNDAPGGIDQADQSNDAPGGIDQADQSNADPDIIAPGGNDQDESIITVHDSTGSSSFESMGNTNESAEDSMMDDDAIDDEASDPTFTTRARIDENGEKPYTRNRNNIFNLFHVALAVNEPSSYKQAMQGEDSEKWKAAMKEEFDSLVKNDTWDLVEKPKNEKIVDNKWVYKVKDAQKNSPERFKARLCARGFTQEYGVNYHETFSPVVRFTSIRIILAIAAQKKMHIKQFDVKTAFLNGDLKEIVYMEQPVGFGDGTNRVCKLKRSLYGLKQSSRCWNEKFSMFIKLFGFKQCKADPCVYISKKNGALTILAIHVDDGIIVGEELNEIKSVIKYLGEQFEIKEMDVGCFLGLEIQQNKDGSIFVHQTTYATKVLMRFNMENCNGVSSPSDANQVMYNFDESEPSSYPYRELVGSLMYLAIGTRPDISHAVGMASRFLEKPTIVHERAAKRILKYLNKTLTYGILYFSSKSDEVKAYSDADYAGDLETRRSTSGSAFMFGESVISWCSERQKSVSLSTTESEYMAASQAVKELVWLKYILCEILDEKSLKISLYLDNQSAIRLIKNPEFHKRTKHIDVRYHFIREKYEENLFTLEYISTNEMIADVFTKALPAPKFNDFVKKLGMSSST